LTEDLILVILLVSHRVLQRQAIIIIKQGRIEGEDLLHEAVVVRDHLGVGGAELLLLFLELLAYNVVEVVRGAA